MSNSAMVFHAQPANFVLTPQIEKIIQRAMTYLQAKIPIHFEGPSGTGKTTLALHVAFLLKRPVVLIHGNEHYGSDDLLGGRFGFRRKVVVDNFIHSVYKSEENLEQYWTDGRITEACKMGYTLIYDEFTRSRPEANNILLSVLEERILELPLARKGEKYLRVHPDFNAIFTSNPGEYAGVFKSQDALRDRMVTIDLGDYDEETQVRVTMAKSGISRPEAEKIVRLIRACREFTGISTQSTLRTAIFMAKALAQVQKRVTPDDDFFRELCFDLLAPGQGEKKNNLISFLEQYC